MPRYSGSAASIVIVLTAAGTKHTSVEGLQSFPHRNAILQAARPSSEHAFGYAPTKAVSNVESSFGKETDKDGNVCEPGRPAERPGVVD